MWSVVVIFIGNSFAEILAKNLATPKQLPSLRLALFYKNKIEHFMRVTGKVYMSRLKPIWGHLNLDRKRPIWVHSFL